MSDKYSRIEVKRFENSPEDIEMIIVDKQVLPCNDEEGRWILYEVMSPQFWLGLQMDYDLDVEEDRLGERLDREVRPYALASS